MPTYSHLERVPVRNQDSRQMTLVIEPWGEEHLLLPGQEVVVTFEGPVGGEVEVEDRPGVKVLYGWEGSVFSVEYPHSGDGVAGQREPSSEPEGRRSA